MNSSTSSADLSTLFHPHPSSPPTLPLVTSSSPLLHPLYQSPLTACIQMQSIN
uniref:Uncharacterized protein n=1 Tax=Musa acuminata subsp. malaccensis TaxID=214687 RepID=A0A804L1T8_MUSAM